MPLPTPLSTGPRKFPRIKIVWGASEVIKGEWRFGLFCFYERVHGFPESGMALSVRALLRWSAVIAVAGYLAGAGALTIWYRRIPHNQVGFTDVLTWPVLRGHMATLRGRAWIAQGMDAVAAKRWAEGLYLLSRGLPLCPEEFDARLTLARFYVLSGQRPRAMALLTDGLAQGVPPPGWIGQATELAAGSEDWEIVLRLCDHGMAGVRRLAEAARWGQRQDLLGRKMVALIALGRANEAVALAEAEGEGAGDSVKLQRGWALLALGRPDAAAAFLASARATVPPDLQPPFLRLQIQALREAARFDDMERSLAELRALHPTRPEPLAFAVEQRARAGRGGLATLDDYLFRFGNQPSNLMFVAVPLALIPDPALVRRVVAAAKERGYPLLPFSAKLAEALLRHGDWTELADVLTELAPRFAESEPEARAWFDWIQRLSRALGSSRPSEQEPLREIMQSRGVSLEARLITVAALHRAGRDETARDVLAAALKSFPASPSLRAQQAPIDRALAAAAPVEAPPSRPALPRPIGNIDDFFRSVDTAIADARWAEARELLRVAHDSRQAPTWAAAHDGDLLWRELHVTQALHDPAAFRIAAEFYANGDASRTAGVLGFARELHAAGANEDAILLVKTVLRKSPDDSKAAALLAEWRPRNPEKAN